MNAKEIALVCHEANRGLTQVLQDVPVQPGWDEVDADMRASCVKGVQFVLDHPDATPEASHAEWCKEREAQGWRLGDVKDPVAKRHPSLRPYAELAEGVRRKDALFQAIVRALR